MAKLYILCGYPFAGKSTVARALISKFGLVRVALNDINSERGIGKDPDKEITSEEWQATYDIYHDRIIDNLKSGKSVIADTVAYTRDSRDGLRKIAEENGAEAVLLYVDTPLEIVRKRWIKNRLIQERPDVSDEDFDEVINYFEIPGKDERVITITPDMTIEEVALQLSLSTQRH